MLVKEGPGRRWKLKGGSMVALVVQMWYTGRSTIAMDAMVTIKFWTCSKQPQKSRRRGWSLNGRSKEAEGTQRHCRGGKMDAQWSANGRHVINALCSNSHSLNLGGAFGSLVPHLCYLCASNSMHWRMTVMTTVAPFGDHREVFQGRHKGCRCSCRETRLSRFRWSLSALVILGVVQRWHEGRSSV